MHNPINILLDFVNKRRDPNAPLYAKDSPQDDHDFDFVAHSLDQLQQEPSDPKARKAWAKEHLRRRPKADLTEPIYRFPAVFWKYHTNINPYFANSPAYTDDHRIESLDTLACILRFHGNTMYETRRKHASEYLSQSQARSMAQLDRLATEWCEHLKQGHDPTDKVKYDILVREQRAAYMLHVNKRVKEGAYTNDDPIIVAARKENRPQPEDELLPPTTLEDAAIWIRNLRGWMLDRCHRHIAAATTRITDSHGQRSVTHADMVICSLALRLNPPPKLTGAAASRRRGTAESSPRAGRGVPVGSSPNRTADTGAAAACPEPVEGSRRRGTAESLPRAGRGVLVGSSLLETPHSVEWFDTVPNSSIPTGARARERVVEACPERSRREPAVNVSPTKSLRATSSSSPSRHRTKRLRKHQPKPKRKP